MSNKEHKTSLSNGSGLGFGEFDFPDGSKYEGEFKDGKEWKGKDYDKDGKIIRTWLNGEEQK